MEKIIELFNTPQAELSYLDSMITLLIIISIVYFMFKDRR